MFLHLHDLHPVGSRCFLFIFLLFVMWEHCKSSGDGPALTDRGVSGVGGWRSRGESVQVDHELCLHPVLLRLNRTCLGFKAQCRRNYEAPVLLKGQEVIEWGLYCETPETGQTTPETLDVAFRKHEKKKNQTEWLSWVQLYRYTSKPCVVLISGDNISAEQRVISTFCQQLRLFTDMGPAEARGGTNARPK